MDKNAEYFNKLLSMQCPLCDHENDIYTFWIYLHCTSVEIVAKKVKDYDSGYAEYEVISFTEHTEFESEN